MFRQIVVGVDGHEGGRDAIALAERLLARDGELTFAHVYPGDPHVHPSDWAAYEGSGRQRAFELLDRTQKETRAQAHLRWRRSASPGRGLHELCELVGADLLVVGSSRRSLLGRIVIGDDTSAALSGVPCAIAIAPAGYAQQPVAMREIGIGYDGSPESEHALQLARMLAPMVGARISAFEVITVPSTALSTGPLPFGEMVSRVVADTRERIAALGDIEPHVAYGEPAEELALYSASLDLLIVGSRGDGPIGRLIHGSTSQDLARSARCPLLVLSRGARVAATPDHRTLPFDHKSPATDHSTPSAEATRSV